MSGNMRAAYLITVAALAGLESRGGDSDDEIGVFVHLAACAEADVEEGSLQRLLITLQQGQYRPK